LFLGGPQLAAESMVRLGYPLYLMKILGFAKIMGAIAILFVPNKTLKEWAYAGFTFDLLGALASHLFVADYQNAPAPVIMGVILFTSYIFWKKNEAV
jgi:DoxX-like family